MRRKGFPEQLGRQALWAQYGPTLHYVDPIARCNMRNSNRFEPGQHHANAVSPPSSGSAPFH